MSQWGTWGRRVHKARKRPGTLVACVESVAHLGEDERVGEAQRGGAELLDDEVRDAVAEPGLDEALGQEEGERNEPAANIHGERGRAALGEEWFSLQGWRHRGAHREGG